MPTKYPPYVNAYGSISTLFEKIKEATVPSKFNQDFLSTKLGLKSSSYRAMIPLLKRLGFLDQGSVPTEHYRKFREKGSERFILAARIKEAYSELFQANEYAFNLSKDELTSKLIALLGVGEDDKIIPCVVGTFLELCKLADFEKEQPKKDVGKKEQTAHIISKQNEIEIKPNRLGISYTINLNLPPTTDIEVFNAIFKSLKEHILND